MNRLRYDRGTPVPKHVHLNYTQDAVEEALEHSIADLTDISPSFKVVGCEVTEATIGTDIEYEVTDGVVCLWGELLPIAAQTIVKASTQVVFIRVQEDSVDVVPVTNAITGPEYVMKRRTAVVAVNNVYPNVGEYMMLTSPTKAELELTKYAKRLLMPGAILPYYGAMDDFTSGGLGTGPMEGWAVCNGLNGTPDLRGMALMGATSMPSFGAPALYSGVAGVTSAGDAVGADEVTLEADQLPEHTHPYIDENVSGTGADVPGGGGFARPGSPKTTGVNATPNNAVSVRQSSRALVFIMSLST